MLHIRSPSAASFGNKSLLDILTPTFFSALAVSDNSNRIPRTPTRLDMKSTYSESGGVTASPLPAPLLSSTSDLYDRRSTHSNFSAPPPPPPPSHIGPQHHGTHQAPGHQHNHSHGSIQTQLSPLMTSDLGRQKGSESVEGSISPVEDSRQISGMPSWLGTASSSGSTESSLHTSSAALPSLSPSGLLSLKSPAFFDGMTGTTFNWSPTTNFFLAKMGATGSLRSPATQKKVNSAAATANMDMGLSSSFYNQQFHCGTLPFNAHAMSSHPAAFSAGCPLPYQTNDPLAGAPMAQDVWASNQNWTSLPTLPAIDQSKGALNLVDHHQQLQDMDHNHFMGDHQLATMQLASRGPMINGQVLPSPRSSAVPHLLSLPSNRTAARPSSTWRTPDWPSSQVLNSGADITSLEDSPSSRGADNGSPMMSSQQPDWTGSSFNGRSTTALGLPPAAARAPRGRRSGGDSIDLADSQSLDGLSMSLQMSPNPGGSTSAPIIPSQRHDSTSTLGSADSSFLTSSCDTTYCTDAARWAAVHTRDPKASAAFFYCVLSTKIFCRTTCPSRRPVRENITFVNTAEQAVALGYRACKRCKPDVTGGDPHEERQEQLINEVKTRLMQSIAAGGKGKAVKGKGLKYIAEDLGVSHWHLHRCFKKRVGTTPEAWARAQALRFKTIDLSPHSISSFRGRRSANCSGGNDITNASSSNMLTEEYHDGALSGDDVKSEHSEISLQEALMHPRQALNTSR